MPDELPWDMSPVANGALEMARAELEQLRPQDIGYTLPQHRMIMRYRAALRALGLTTEQIDRIALDGDGPA